MNILIAAWEKCDWERIKKTWEVLNHSAVLYFEKPRDRKQDPRFRSILRKFIKDAQIDAVFSINYYPILSRFARRRRQRIFAGVRLFHLMILLKMRWGIIKIIIFSLTGRLSVICKRPNC